jgi:flagellar hook-length control protein FliK
MLQNQINLPEAKASANVVGERVAPSSNSESRNDDFNREFDRQLQNQREVKQEANREANQEAQRKVQQKHELERSQEDRSNRSANVESAKRSSASDVKEQENAQAGETESSKEKESKVSGSVKENQDGNKSLKSSNGESTTDSASAQLASKKTEQEQFKEASQLSFKDLTQALQSADPELSIQSKTEFQTVNSLESLKNPNKSDLINDEESADNDKSASSAATDSIAELLSKESNAEIAIPTNLEQVNSEQVSPDGAETKSNIPVNGEVVANGQQAAESAAKEVGSETKSERQSRLEQLLSGLSEQDVKPRDDVNSQHKASAQSDKESVDSNLIDAESQSKLKWLSSTIENAAANRFEKATEVTSLNEMQTTESAKSEAQKSGLNLLNAELSPITQAINHLKAAEQNNDGLEVDVSRTLSTQTGAANTATQLGHNAAQDKAAQLFKALSPEMQALLTNGGAGNGANNGAHASQGEQNGDEQFELETLLDANLVKAKPGKVEGEGLLRNELNLSSTSQSAILSSLDKADDSSSKPTTIETLGVQLERNFVPAKIENLSQQKHELMIRENILFNKQELANTMQQQVGLMLARNMKSVDIRLDPPELGAMQVRLSVNNEQAAVNFVVSTPQAKEALDAAMPRLREMLEQQGMQLADSDVKQDSGQGQAHESDQAGQSLVGNNGTSEEEDIGEMTQQTVQIPTSPWNVDYYA